MRSKNSIQGENMHLMLIISHKLTSIVFQNRIDSIFYSKINMAQNYKAFLRGHYLTTKCYKSIFK